MMEIENLIQVKSRGDLRIWLQENCKIEKFCWVLVSMKPTPDMLLYLDAVEEALCFGWIDGVKRKYLKRSWRRDCLLEVKKFVD